MSSATTAISVASTTSLAPTTTVAPPIDFAPERLLERFHAALEGGDADAAMALLNPDALWSRLGIELRLDQPITEELAWLPPVLGLPESASARDIVRTVIDFQAALRTKFRVIGCVEDGPSLMCSYEERDALTAIGPFQEGTVSLVVGDGGIAHYSVESQEVGETTDDADDFKRWAAVQDPAVTTSDFGNVDYARLVVTLIDEWGAAGRPESRVVDPSASSTDVVEAFFEARNEGDWETMVFLMAGDALEDPFGNRDEFDAAQLLERRITPVDCEVQLESETIGTRVGCHVTVSDIVVEAAGVTPTNPNRTTLQVLDGRVTSLPQFIPSLFRAESAIEEWVQITFPDEYVVACPDGIAGQSPLDGLDCARFIVDHRADWTPIVSDLGL